MPGKFGGKFYTRLLRIGNLPNLQLREYSVMYGISVLYCIVLCCIVLCCVVLCCVVLCCVVLCGVVWCGV